MFYFSEPLKEICTQNHIQSKGFWIIHLIYDMIPQGKKQFPNESISNRQSQIYKLIVVGLEKSNWYLKPLKWIITVAFKTDKP